MVKSFYNFFLLLSLLFSNGLSAQLSVAKLFSDNMVLQQNAEVSIWGWSNAGDTVEVTGSWDNKTILTIADNDRKWNAKLNTPEAKTDETSYSVVIKGENTIVLNDVLIGEVWLLSGQSNMEMPLGNWSWANTVIEGSAQAISTANFPNIRLLTINHKSAGTPQPDITNSTAQQWKVCTPTTAKSFSAVGFFFGRELFQNLNIPVGLVCSSWGGSSCETWANQGSLDFVPDYAGKGPWIPNKTDDNHTATVLYNGMIAPLVPFNFAGVCWYQGETNVGRAQQLTDLFPSMIEGWRNDFQKENLPFYFVQIAPYGGFAAQSLFEFWEAQTNTLNLHHTEMAETLDVGDAEDIHPTRKEPVGSRLAKKALANVYGRDSLVFAGPRYKSFQIEDNKIRLFFNHTGSGLTSPDEDLKNFEIAGSNNYFYPAKVEIDGNEVVVWNDNVVAPKNVRYAFQKNATASLFNNEGFPAIPFRTNPPAWIEPVKINFLVDNELINESEPVNLRWTTLGADTVKLNGEVVSFANNQDFFPDATTTYTITANDGKNTFSKKSNVYVIPKELNYWSKRKTTESSSNQNGYGAALAVDEDKETFWKSNISNNQWILLDLGEVIPTELIILEWGSGFAKSYDIQVSIDKLNWSTIHSENNGDGGIDFIPDLNAEGRYVRIFCGTRSLLTAGFEIKEFGIYSKEFRQTGTLLDKNGEVLRGTPMVLGKNLDASVAFATDIKNWETIKNNGFNTIRVCWVDPWYKNHDRSYWSVSEVLPYFDKCVENAVATGMNIIINYHDVGAQQEFDKTFTFKMETEFWDSISPRYKNNDLVYYEIANEPTFRMNDYLEPVFKQNLLKIYNNIRQNAPERHILMFSFNTIVSDILQVVEDYKNNLDWDFTSVAYHMYNSNSSEAVKTLMAYHRVICTEWNYDHVSKRENFAYIKQVDGFKQNSETMEKIGSGWIDWRDWSDTSLNELLDTLILDAKLKDYWWGVSNPEIKVTEVKISDKKIKLNSGKTKQLTAIVYPALAGNQNVNWSSSNSEYVSVNEKGMITATATQNKTAVISVKTEEGNFISQCEVQVIAPEKKGAYPDGGAHIIPGSINPTFYDLGGEGVGYHDLNQANSGDGIRPEQGVDTEYRLPEGTIGGIQSGEWLEYTIDVQEDGLFNIEILFATPGRFGQFHIEFDEENKTGLVYVNPSTGYSDFRPTKIQNIYLKKGIQVMRIYFDFASYNMGTISISGADITNNKVFNESSSTLVYPNPASDKLFITGQQNIEYYTIQTVTGQIIVQAGFQNQRFIDLKNITKGAYIISIAGKDFRKTSTFIKL